MVREVRSRNGYGWLFRILPHVLANARIGSPVQKAFCEFDEQRERDGGPTWGARNAAAGAWRLLEAREQQRILNGWNPDDVFDCREDPSWRQPADWEPVLRLMGGNNDELHFIRMTTADDGSLTPLELTIKMGTDKPTVLAGLRAMLAAVDKHFDGAIGLGVSDENYMNVTVPAGAMPDAEAALEAAAAALARVQTVLGMPVAQAKAAQAEKKPRTVSTQAPKLGGKGRGKKTAAAV